MRKTRTREIAYLSHPTAFHLMVVMATETAKEVCCGRCTRSGGCD